MVVSLIHYLLCSPPCLSEVANQLGSVGLSVALFSVSCSDVCHSICPRNTFSRENFDFMGLLSCSHVFNICMYTVRSRVFFVSSIVLQMRGDAIGMLGTLLIQPPPA